MASFDINDRTTWNWVNDGAVTCTPDDAEYQLNPYERASFYQCSGGVAYRHACPDGMVFNPMLGTCDYQTTEQEVYNWAIENGVVAPDQRSVPSDYVAPEPDFSAGTSPSSGTGQDTPKNSYGDPIGTKYSRNAAGGYDKI